jgi:hypothetical protein
MKSAAHIPASELAHIHTGAEITPGAGQHDSTDLIVLTESLECLEELASHIHRDRVLLVRTRQRHNGNPVPGMDFDGHIFPLEQTRSIKREMQAALAVMRGFHQLKKPA